MKEKNAGRKKQAKSIGFQLTACLLLMLIAVADVGAQPKIRNKPRFVPGEVIIKYRSSVAASVQESYMQRLGINIVRRSATLGFLRGRTTQDVNKIIQACKADPNIEYAELNYYVYAVETIPEGAPFAVKQ